MFKKVLLGILAIVVIVGTGLFVWARSVLTQDTVRTAIAARLTDTLGQPVSIGGIGATIYPRVTVNLENVAIGPQTNIHVNTLAIGTDFRALLSRRIEHGTMRLVGARIRLPLPPLALGSQPTAPVTTTAPSGAPVEIVSIDEIVLTGVEIVSGGRTLRGDIEVVPQGRGVSCERLR